MATPRPIRATRYCTTNETSVKVVRPRITSRAVRIDTAAISSGMKASREPNTNASTASAPTPPSSVSARTLVSWPPPLPLLASSSRPVTWTVAPAGRLRCSACATLGPRSGAFGPKLPGTNTSPKVTRPCGPRDRGERAGERLLDAGGVDGSPGRQDDDGHQRLGVAAVAIQPLDGLGGLVALLAGQGELGGQAAGHAAGAGKAGDQHRQPEQPHQPPVPQDESRQGGHQATLLLVVGWQSGPYFTSRTFQEPVRNLGGFCEPVGRPVQRQLDAEGGALSRDGLDGRPAAVGGDDGGHDRQAETGAAMALAALTRARPGPVSAPEALEDPFALLAGQAGTSVGDLQQRGPPPVGEAGPHPHRGGRRRVLQHVGDQVGEHLPQPVRVALHHHRPVALQGDGRSGSTARASATASAASAARSTGARSSGRPWSSRASSSSSSTSAPIRADSASIRRIALARSSGLALAPRRNSSA